MKTIVQRKLLNKLCYKVAALADVLEFRLEDVKVQIHDSSFSILWSYPLRNSDIHCIIPKYMSIKTELEIKGDEYCEEYIDFFELCRTVSSLPKSVKLLEMELTENGISLINTTS